MKLRIQGETIRLRLQEGETERLKTEGRLEEKLPLDGGASFSYALESDPEIDEITARLETSGILISVPEKVLRVWLFSPKEDLQRKGSPKIVIEVDRIPSS